MLTIFQKVFLEVLAAYKKCLSTSDMNTLGVDPVYAVSDIYELFVECLREFSLEVLNW